jgi:hypothetical protein
MIFASNALLFRISIFRIRLQAACGGKQFAGNTLFRLRGRNLGEMNRRLLTGILLAVFCSLQTMAVAQYQLVLENPRAFKRERIYVGDEIAIRVKGMDQVYAGELMGVKSDRIFMFGDSLDPKTFDRIHIARPRAGINMLRGAFIMTSILYPVMMVLNLPPDQWTWNRAAQVAGVSASALVIQKLLKLGFWKRKRLDRGQWRLRIMPTVESL